MQGPSIITQQVRRITAHVAASLGRGDGMRTGAKRANSSRCPEENLLGTGNAAHLTGNAARRPPMPSGRSRCEAGQDESDGRSVDVYPNICLRVGCSGTETERDRGSVCVCVREREREGKPGASSSDII